MLRQQTLDANKWPRNVSTCGITQHFGLEALEVA